MTCAKSAQSTSHLLFVRPAAFFSNPQTSPTNAYQGANNTASPDDVYAEALSEFDGFTGLLASHGIAITQIGGSRECPDHIFPGNWASTHANNIVAYYPMLAENRRKERTPVIKAFLEKNNPRVLDFSRFEDEGKFLEGTGSFALDRVSRKAFMAVSDRSHLDAAEIWAKEMDYRLITFRTKSSGGLPIYHTDLLLYIGTTIAGLCAEAIVEEDRSRVVDELRQTHEILDFSKSQMDEMCGNALEANNGEERFLIMSSRAYAAYMEEQKSILRRYYADILHAPLQTIETHGGGSARCMILEIF